MRLLVATDAWHPQVNGVVRSLDYTALALGRLGVATDFLTPLDFRTVSCPGYDEIPISLATHAAVSRHLDARAIDAIHIATEGPIGLAVRRYCLTRGLRFTTSFHTRFPEYLRARLPVPLSWSYGWLRRFHGAAAATLVSTESLRRELGSRRFTNLALWSRGVDTDLFKPRRTDIIDRPRPIFLSVGRLAVEKNLDAFLSLSLPGTKVVVGDGPQRKRLGELYPDTLFLGARTGADLAAIYAAADVFVFPSRTDTFGMVLLEALASGIPVAAFPVQGPLDVIGQSGAGILDEDLRSAALSALGISGQTCRERARDFSWEASARQFLRHLVPTRGSCERQPVDMPSLHEAVTHGLPGF